MEEEFNFSVRKIVKGAGLVFIGIILSKIFGLIYLLILTRWGGATQYGLLSLGIDSLTFLTAIAILGLDTALAKYIPQYLKKNNKEVMKMIAYSTFVTFCLSFFFGVLLFRYSEVLAYNLFHNLKMNIVLKIIAIGIPLNALINLFLGIVKAFQKVEYEVYSKNLILNLCQIGFTLVALSLGLGIFGLSMAYVASLFITLLILFYFIEFKIFPFIQHKIILDKLTKEITSFSAPLVFVSLLTSLIFWVDGFMLAYFKNALEVGVYKAVIPLAHLTYIIPYALTIIFMPIASGFYIENKVENLKAITKTITKWILIPNLFILLMIILFSRRIIDILFIQEYSIGWLAFVILGVSYFIHYLMICSSFMLIILKKTKLLFLDLVIGSVSTIILNYKLIPLYGLTGAAISTGFSLILIALLYGAQSYYYLKINPFKKVYIKIIFSILVTLIFGILFIPAIERLILPTIKLIGELLNKDFYNRLISLLISMGILGLFYIIMIIVTKSFEEDDLMIIKIIREKTKLKLSFLTKFFFKPKDI
ncbi:oligosaccharide flippase family protein [Candidatus Woesearchaeota archaeon]|nr:oligosaccharide flippase family protein [Candidatus Woesearchaeota archaeon]